MSENAKQAEEQREKYTVEVEDHEDFEADAQIKVLTSNELCKLANEYFHAAFADYEGCQVEMSNGQMSFYLVFNHGKHDDETVHYAVDMASKENVGNDVIRRARQFDRLAKEGDRYHITQDGIDIIKDFIFPRYVDRKTGKANWGNLVSDFSERSNSYYGPTVQLTKVANIDPKAICAKVFGYKGEDGVIYDYSVDVKGVVNALYAGATKNYVLWVTKASAEHMAKTFEKLGVGTVASSFIR